MKGQQREDKMPHEVFTTVLGHIFQQHCHNEGKKLFGNEATHHVTAKELRQMHLRESSKPHEEEQTDREAAARRIRTCNKGKREKKWRHQGQNMHRWKKTEKNNQ